MEMGISEKTKVTLTCSSPWVVLIALIVHKYMFSLFFFLDKRHVLIYDKICTYIMVQLCLGIGVRSDYLGFSFGYPSKSRIDSTFALYLGRCRLSF